MNAAVMEVRESSVRYLAQAEPALLRGFESLTKASGGVGTLRALIRSLAVRGLLVQQNASEQPANEVLAIIREEKDRLIARGLVKRDKPSVPVNIVEQPFVVPPSWNWVRVADVCSLVTDGEHATPQRCEDATAIPLVTAKNVRSEFMDYTVTDFVPNDVATKCWLRCKPELGDILMVSVGATIGRLCVLREPVDMVLVRSVTVLRPVHGGVFSDYLALHLMSSGSQREIWSEVKQSAQPCLYLAKSAAIKIALPPLAEQHRIVARVEELMKLCDTLEQSGQLADQQHARLTSTLFDALAASESAHALAENWQRIAEHFDLLLDRPEAIDALEQTILQLAVRGLLVPRVRGSAEWRQTAMGDVIEFLNGYAFKSEWFRAAGVQLVRNVNVAHGSLEWSQRVCVDESVARELSRFALSEGDVLVSLDRPIISTGLKYAVVRQQDLPSMLLQRVARLKPCEGVLAPEYLELWLNSPEFTGNIDPGRSNGVPHISTRQLQAIPFPLPPLADQHRIVARVDELRRLCTQLRERLTKARQTQTLLADALVTQATRA